MLVTPVGCRACSTERCQESELQPLVTVGGAGRSQPAGLVSLASLDIDRRRLSCSNPLKSRKIECLPAKAHISQSATAKATPKDIFFVQGHF